MAKGFGKGFVTGVAGTVAAVADQKNKKQLSSKKTAKKQHVAVSHTNHSKSSGQPGLFLYLLVAFTF